MSKSTESRFFVEMAADAWGNRGYTNSFPCVIEAVVTTGESGDVLNIVNPPEIASKWPRILRWVHGGWLEVDGPSRPLTYDEREELIRQKKEN